jgi:hypothetical protein
MRAAKLSSQPTPSGWQESSSDAQATRSVSISLQTPKSWPKDEFRANENSTAQMDVAKQSVAHHRGVEYVTKTSAASASSWESSPVSPPGSILPSPSVRAVQACVHAEISAARPQASRGERSILESHRLVNPEMTRLSTFETVINSRVYRTMMSCEPNAGTKECCSVRSSIHRLTHWGKRRINGHSGA